MSTFQPDATAHHLDKLICDRQTEPGSAELSSRRTVDLSKRVKDRFRRFRRNSNAGIADLKVQCDRRICLRGDCDLNDDFTLLGKLDGVSDEVRQGLHEPPRIGDDCSRYARRDSINEFQSLLLSPHCQSSNGCFELFPNIEPGRDEPEPSGLDSREIQDVIDDRQQVVRGCLDQSQVFALNRRQFRIQNQFRHAKNSVERRTQLVAHVRQKLRLVSTAVLGRLKCAGQILLMVVLTDRVRVALRAVAL